MDFGDIFKKIPEMLNPPEKEMISSAIVGVAGAINPVLGIFVDEIKVFNQQYGNFQLLMLLKGLSGGLNEEKYLNELYNYVSASKTKAFQIGNVLKETLAAKTPKICMLYGMIIANHIVEEQKDFSMDDVIVCNALENATDFDLDNFKDIITSYINSDGYVEYPMEEKERYSQTCSWAVYNRLLTRKAFRNCELSGKYDADAQTAITGYCPNSASYVLFDLITSLKNTWEY